MPAGMLRAGAPLPWADFPIYQLRVKKDKVSDIFKGHTYGYHKLIKMKFRINREWIYDGDEL